MGLGWIHLFLLAYRLLTHVLLRTIFMTSNQMIISSLFLILKISNSFDHFYCSMKNTFRLRRHPSPTTTMVLEQSSSRNRSVPSPSPSRLLPVLYQHRFSSFYNLYGLFHVLSFNYHFQIIVLFPQVKVKLSKVANTRYRPLQRQASFKGKQSRTRTRSRSHLLTIIPGPIFSPSSFSFKNLQITKIIQFSSYLYHN